MQQLAIRLVAAHGSGACKPYDLKPNQAVLVGKSSNCGLQLVGDDISDIHCRIGFEDGQLWVQDWLSLSGTKVNGESLSAKTQVDQGSVIEIGGYKIQVVDLETAHRVADKEASPKSNPHSLKPDRTSDGSKTNPVPVVVAFERSSDDASTSAGHSGAEINPVKVANQQASNKQEKLAEPSRAQNDKKIRPIEIDKIRQPNGPKKGAVSADINVDLFSDDGEVYDRETVELLLAEIEDLRTALAMRDADVTSAFQVPTQVESEAEESEGVLHRIQELVEEANRADERVMILEEMLHAAEDANRSEVEERAHLEAWVSDIEKRVGQREQEHAAEIEAVRERLASAGEQYIRLQRELQGAAATGDSVQVRHEQMLESLQQENRQLQDSLETAQKDLRQLQQKYENQSEQSEVALREDRAKIAREHAEMSRLKFEYAQKLRSLEEVETKSIHEDDPRLESLREHRQYLREMSEDKKTRQQSTLSGRLKRIWSLVE
jgi:hypothetical protein